MMFLCLNVLRHKVLKLGRQVVNHSLYLHTHIYGISYVTNNKCAKVS